MQELPVNIVQEVISFLDYSSILSLIKTCRKLFSYRSNKELWQNVSTDVFPIEAKHFEKMLDKYRTPFKAYLGLCKFFYYHDDALWLSAEELPLRRKLAIFDDNPSLFEDDFNFTPSSEEVELIDACQSYEILDCLLNKVFIGSLPRSFFKINPERTAAYGRALIDYNPIYSYENLLVFDDHEEILKFLNGLSLWIFDQKGYLGSLTMAYAIWHQDSFLKALASYIVKFGDIGFNPEVFEKFAKAKERSVPKSVKKITLEVIHDSCIADYSKQFGCDLSCHELRKKGIVDKGHLPCVFIHACITSNLELLEKTSKQVFYPKFLLVATGISSTNEVHNWLVRKNIASPQYLCRSGLFASSADYVRFAIENDCL